MLPAPVLVAVVLLAGCADPDPDCYGDCWLPEGGYTCTISAFPLEDARFHIQVFYPATVIHGPFNNATKVWAEWSDNLVVESGETAAAVENDTSSLLLEFDVHVTDGGPFRIDGRYTGGPKGNDGTNCVANIDPR